MKVRLNPLTGCLMPASGGSFDGDISEIQRKILCSILVEVDRTGDYPTTKILTDECSVLFQEIDE